MDDAGLHNGVGEGSVDRIWKALKAINHSKQNVFNAAILELVHDIEPEFGTLILLDPHAQNLLLAPRLREGRLRGHPKQYG